MHLYLSYTYNYEFWNSPAISELSPKINKEEAQGPVYGDCKLVKKMELTTTTKGEPYIAIEATNAILPANNLRLR